MTEVKLLSPWRRRFQWTATLIVLLLPWFRIGGESLVRVDIPNLSLHFFGQVLRIEELYLFLLLSLALALAFLLITLVFGRVWCGWACPQTTLSDLAEWLARKSGLTVSANRLAGDAWRLVMVQVLYALLAFLVASNLLWYFIDPRQYFFRLAGGDLPFAAWATLLIVFGVVYVDLAVVRRLLCRDVCPYGRIQTSLVDQGTLTLHLPAAESTRCIECGSCVRACPMEIDIRRGYQVECINCGRCLDACRKVMARHDQRGLIRYSFGTGPEGARVLLNPRTLLVAIAMTGLLVTFVVAFANRPVASLKISRSHLAADRQLASGESAYFFNAWIGNRDPAEHVFDIRAHDTESGTELPLRGQTRQIRVPGGENRRVDFALVLPRPETGRPVAFELKDSRGTTLAVAEATMTPTGRNQ